jgi:acetyl esterase/lipase
MQLLPSLSISPSSTQIVKDMPKGQPLVDIPSMRTMVNQHFKNNVDALGPLPEGTNQTERTIIARDSFDLRLLIFQPKTAPRSGSPLIVLFHGGGGCIGTPEMETQNCRMLAQAYGAVVLSAQYRLAPEYPFPYPVLDAWDDLKWAAANAGALGANPSSGFIVGGTSAGGRIAATLVALARDQGLSPPLTGQYLCVGPYSGVRNIPGKYKHLLLSYEQNSNALLFNKTVRDIFLDAYKPDDDSPLYAVMELPNGHKGLPPAYFQVCGSDPSRDDSLVYEKILREEGGVKTRLDIYPGLPHCWWDFFTMLSATKKKYEDTVKGVGWLLGRDPKKSA